MAETAPENVVKNNGGVIMYKISMHVEGMMCPMCEKHMNDAIKNAFDVKKVTSSHTDKKTEILSKVSLSEEEVRTAVAETGYQISDFSCEEKKGLFSR